MYNDNLVISVPSQALRPLLVTYSEFASEKTTDQRVVTFTGILGTAEDPRDPSKRVQVFIPVKAVTAATEAVKAAEDCVKSTVSMAAVSVPASGKHE